MADNIWDASTDNDANTAANWSLGTVPAGTDIMTFDSATTNANCNLSGNISCQGMKFANTYTGTIDAVTHNITLGSSGFSGTNGGSATVLMGTGTWFCAGDFDAYDLSTKSDEQSTLEMDGTTQLLTHSRPLNIVTIKSTSTTTINNASSELITGLLTVESSGALIVTNSQISCGGGLTINGTLTANALVIVTSAMTTGASSTVGGSASLRATTGASISVTNGATWSLDVETRNTITVGSPTTATLGGTFLFDQRSASDETLTFTGGLTFTGAVTFAAEEASNTYTVDTNTNDASLTFQGHVTWSEVTSTLTWDAGTGTITFSGTSNQIVTVPASWTDELEDIVINKTGGSVQLAGDDLYCQSLDIQDGDFDPNGLTLFSAGSVSVAAGARFWNVTTDTAVMDEGSTIDIDSGVLTLTGAA